MYSTALADWATFKDRLQQEKDFSHSLVCTLLVQSNSVIVLDKTIVLQIVINIRSSYFLINVLILVRMKYLYFY